MPTADKIEKVSELTEKLRGANAIYLADFTGLDVASVTELRNQLREASIEYHVVKNRLAKLATAGLRRHHLEKRSKLVARRA